MANTELYVRYKDNAPVPIDTSYGRGPQQLLPLLTVSHLVAAVKQSLPSKLGSIDLDELTLHFIDGIESAPLEMNLLLSTITTGTTAKTALFIKSKNDCDSSNSYIKDIQSDNANTEHLKRPGLIAKLTDLVSKHQFVRLTSPPASGKTSLLRIFEQSLKKTKVFWISCFDKRVFEEQLLEIGIDCYCEKTSYIFRKKRAVVFIDDAQEKLGHILTLIDFLKLWLPQSIRFIISSNRYPSSPDQPKPLPTLDRSDFLLTPTESKEFLKFYFVGLPQKIINDYIKAFLIRECDGLIGALRLSVDSIKEQFSKGREPSVIDLLHHILSNDFISKMDLCFGSSHSLLTQKDFVAFVKKIYFGGEPYFGKFESQSDYCSLKKSGIFVEFASIVVFTSNSAKRFYFNWIFAKRSFTLPASLTDLIKSVICYMPSRNLKNTLFERKLEKEAVFLELFMKGLSFFTPPSCSIISDISKVFPAATDVAKKTIDGEMDFYLNDSIHWGIGMTINGGKIEEKINRFAAPNGKYSFLDLNDYVVVDFRICDYFNVSTHPKLITVFLEIDSSRTEYYFSFSKNISHAA